MNNGWMVRSCRLLACLAVFAVGAIGSVSACSVDSSLTCGDSCVDAGTDTTTGMDGSGDTSTGNDAVADQIIQDVNNSDVATDGGVGGGLDANCHAPDSSIPELACPASGCCPNGGQDYQCGTQGQCCKGTSAYCQSGNTCCSKSCAQGQGGNGQCAPSCVPLNQPCSQSTDCCVNSWCNWSSKCTTCTQHGQSCTSNYECCSNDTCQQNFNDGGKTCQNN